MTMAVAKNTNLERPKKPVNISSAWRESRELIWAHRHRLSLGFFLMIVNRLSGLVMPLLSKLLFDEVIEKKRPELLTTIAVAGAAATVVQALTSFALGQVLGVAAQRAITEMRKSAEDHIMRLPVNYFDSTQTGVLISRIMSDADGIRNLIGTGLVQLVGGLLTAAVALCILFYLHWQMTSVILVILVVFGGCLAYTFTKLRPVFRERAKINGEVTGRLSQSLGGVRVVKAYTAEKREGLVFAKGVHRLFRNVNKSLTGTSGITAVSTVIVGVAGVVISIWGGHAILSGEMTKGEFIEYVAFIGMVAMPVVQIAAVGTQISEAFAGLDRLREIKRIATEDQGDEKREPLKDVRGDVIFSNVGFEYVPGVPVLKNVSFVALSGTTTALVGSSGSGKSTLISLVMAFNRPLSGKITLDGRSLDSVGVRDYRHHLGVVLQDNFLFDGTIAENIAFARPHANIEDIQRAARIAHCADFIEGFEQKYETVVGERGVRLSGGQRQRVAIARAILADPKILILDEATSSLDSESEGMIQDGLDSLRAGRTSFVIAHRLSTIQSADQILVLEHGEIVERGTHSELLALGGRYKQLYDRQYKLERNRFINPGEDFTPEPQKAMVRDPN